MAAEYSEIRRCETSRKPRTSFSHSNIILKWDLDTLSLPKREAL